MTTLVAGQIVFLECGQTRLYAEVIQVLSARQIGWVRPLALVDQGAVQLLSTDLAADDTRLHRPATPDMLWPLGQLQPALDTDVMPLLTPLPSKPTPDKAGDVSTAGQTPMTVNEFVQRLWDETLPRESVVASPRPQSAGFTQNPDVIC